MNISGAAELVITQADDHVRKRSISQLIGGISRVLQKVLKYFNGTTIWTFFVLPSGGGFSVPPNLKMNDLKFNIPALCRSSL